MKKKLLLFLTLLFLAVPVYAEELDTMTTGILDGELTTTQEYKNELLFKVGDTVKATGSYNGSGLVAGETVRNNAFVKGANLTFGNTVKVNGTSDYALVAGNAITMNGIINNDVAIFGNTIEANLNVLRDTFMFASSINLEGSYDRNVRLYASNVEINNVTIKGDLYISATNVTIGDDVTVTGSIKLNSDCKVDAPSAITYDTYKVDKVEITFMDKFYTYLNGLLCTIALFIVLALVVPKMFTKLDKKFDDIDILAPFINIGKGALLLIVCPIAIVLLFVSVIGVYLGLLGIGLFVALLAFASLYVSYMIGYLVWTKLFKKENNVIVAGLIGVVIVSLLQLISVITIFVVFMGMGLILDLFKKD